MKLGFNGVGKYFNFVFRIFISKGFETNLDEHVVHEFKLLAKQLAHNRQCKF
jgi:hypothetical protein